MELILDDVTKRYGDGTQIGPVSLQIEKGEFFSFLGPSGCGKTTILRCIAGFESLTAGTINLRGARLDKVPAHRRNIGIVFQSYALFPHLTIFENVAFGLRLRPLKEAEIKKRVAEALDLVGMPELGARYTSQISGGQQQRVAIARAIVLEPAVILFDEPLSNLDLKLRLQLRIELRRLQRQLGMTAIFVTHDQSEAMTLSDRIAVFSRGHVEQIGTPSEIYEQPNSTMVADFIGNANILQGTIGRNGTDAVFDAGNGLHLRLLSEPANVGQQVTALIRPEHIQVMVHTDTRCDMDNVLAGTLEDMTYLGEDLHLRIASPSAPSLLVTMKSRDEIRQMKTGQAMSIRVPPDRIHILKG